MDTNNKNLKTLIYCLFCFIVISLSKKLKLVKYLIIVLLLLGYLKKMIAYPEKITKHNGWTIEYYIKALLVIFVAILFISESKLLNNYANPIIWLNIFVMIFLTVYTITWNNKTNQFNYKRKIQLIPLILLIYLLITFPNFRYDKGAITNPNFNWLILCSIALSFIYIKNEYYFKYGHGSLPSLVSVWLPFIFPIKDYFYVRAITLSLQTIWNIFDDNSFDKYWE